MENNLEVLKEDDLKDLFSDKNCLKIIKNKYPRILEAQIIDDYQLIIEYYGADNMEKWIDNYGNLDNILKTCFNKHHKDKVFRLKVITNI